MTYADAIKSGLKLINRNWQLVAVQAVMMIVNCIGFFVIVGIPLGIAFIVFGLDLTGLAETRDIMGLLRNPSDLISKYMGLVLIVVASFFIYLLIVTTAGLFIFAGSVGTIGGAVLDPSRKFSLKLFFTEAKKTFYPLLRFSMFMGLVFIVIAFFLGLFGGGVSAIVQSASSQDLTLSLFLGIFFKLLLGFFAISLTFGVIAVTVYGIAVLFFKTEGTVRAFRDAVTFLWNRQPAFWLSVLLTFFYFIASFILMLFSFPFNLVPIIGTLISFPLQLVLYLVQSYIGLAILGVIFIYYYEAEIRKTEGTADIVLPSDPGKTTDESSSWPEDISDSETPQQEVPHPVQGQKDIV
jgi:hypothetical protein